MILSLIKVGKTFPKFNTQNDQPFLSQLVKCGKRLKHTLTELVEGKVDRKSQC